MMELIDLAIVALEHNGHTLSSVIFVCSWLEQACKPAALERLLEGELLRCLRQHTISDMKKRFAGMSRWFDPFVTASRRVGTRRSCCHGNTARSTLWSEVFIIGRIHRRLHKIDDAVDRKMD